ncbi:MAG: DUF861 domain-containing protein [Candidatus Cloacimonetes bacterium]|nr:DUF861 domain-containing protein [Candidatus Cloacimonadota bacterium]
MASLVIKKLSEEEIQRLGIRNWPIWEKEISRFDWYYDNTEECLLIEGEVEVETTEGTYHFGKGDFVVFQKGLKCVWNIKQPVRKYYNFEE